MSEKSLGGKKEKTGPEGAVDSSNSEKQSKITA